MFPLGERCGPTIAHSGLLIKVHAKELKATTLGSTPRLQVPSSRLAM